MTEEFQIEIFQTGSGKLPYLEWESSLNAKDRAVVTARLVRIRLGNLGDCKTIKGASGVYEIRINFGPGYRIKERCSESQNFLGQLHQFQKNEVNYESVKEL